MKIEEIYNSNEISELAKARYIEERGIDHLEGWFLAKEIMKECDNTYREDADCIRVAKTLVKVFEKIPLWISDCSVFAGTQDDAFSRTYALINPDFKVEEFSGYCDPVAVFNDINPIDEITQKRIDGIKEYCSETSFSRKLKGAYDIAGNLTEEAVFFVEQVSGHLIPDMRTVLKVGITGLKEQIKQREKAVVSEKHHNYYKAMDIALDAALVLAKRYCDIAIHKAAVSLGKDKDRYLLIADTLKKIPKYGASDVYEAIQLYILMWQVMCVEQTPNPYAFSVGNADRIFEPYRELENTGRDMTAALFKHFLVFFNVGDRSWAISQNLIIGGKDEKGKDLTNRTSYALFDAYYDMMLPQPILSVKLHKNTPSNLYGELGRFLFTPGHLTPSFFNDDMVFQILKEHRGVDDLELADYSIAGCQEPLIMGKDNGNTTNSWLNMGKILELCLNDGISTLSGKKYGKNKEAYGCSTNLELLKNIREVFYKALEEYVDIMVDSANEASRAISILQVPFLSTLMGGIESGIDVRDVEEQGTKYNGSGCLIHGLSIVADSFVAIDRLISEHPEYADRLIDALKNNYRNDPEIRQYMMTAPKYGNNIQKVDEEASIIAEKISGIISSKKNYLGNSFRADWATPSTHLIYGYQVGATPDGRLAREQLGYGVDPLFGEANQGLGNRVLSLQKLPFDKMDGGVASHLGINPKYFRKESFEEKGVEFGEKVLKPLFFNKEGNKQAPFYLYVNVTTPEMLRKVLADPMKYAPSGVYIMRIHGTFVNFLDLSPDIQQDIIKRLDMESTSM